MSAIVDPGFFLRDPVPVALIVRFHMHPEDRDELCHLSMRERSDRMHLLVPAAWRVGGIEIYIGQPVRRGLVRAEHPDGAYEWVRYCDHTGGHVVMSKNGYYWGCLDCRYVHFNRNGESVPADEDGADGFWEWYESKVPTRNQ